MDLWTGHNRKGYIGITCSYINKDFKLNEVTLLIQYIPYLHTAIHICKTVNKIIENYGLNGKVHLITTDNAANMKNVVLNMAGINWQGCSSYTLQLVIGKSMKLYKTLIACAKRLIDFFLHPKQFE